MVIVMNKEEIKRQLKLSKQQNKNERYDYLCSQFNCVNYAIKLEKYTNKLQQENQKYKEVIDNIEKIIIDNSYNELYGCFNELREERVIEIVNVLDIKKDMLKRWNK